MDRLLVAHGVTGGRRLASPARVFTAPAGAAGRAGRGLARTAGSTAAAAGGLARAAGPAGRAAGQMLGLAGSVVGQGALVAGQAGRAGGQAASYAGSAARRAAANVGAAAAANADLGPRRRRRRVWARPGRAHIEVRGLTGHGSAHHRLREDVTAGLTRLRGVRWAEVNAATAQVLIDFDSASVTVDKLVHTVEAIEHAHSADSHTFSWSDPAHPADDAPVFTAAAGLAADLAGVAAAASSRVLPFLRLPAAIRVPIVVAESQPRLRAALHRRFGPAGGDLLLTTASALAHGLSRGMSPLAVDAASRLFQLGEANSRRLVWARREQELHATGHDLPSERHAPPPRPAPLPPGPLETVSTWTSLAGLGGAGAVLAWARGPGQASDVILATGPKAARLGREGFAAMAGMALGGAGVVPMDGAALRRLDRITAVVIDSSALCSPRARVLSPADGSDPLPDPQDWQAAERILAACSVSELAGPGPWAAADGRWRLARRAGRAADDVTGPSGLWVDLLDHENRRRASFLAGCELDLHAETLLGAARDCADRLILTEHVSTSELVVWADEVVPAQDSLAGEVRRLQGQGHGVMLIATVDPLGLSAADLGVGQLTQARGVCWTADLVCGPGLIQAWRVLSVTAAARRASERAARLSVGGSAIGALLVSTGQGPRRTRQGIAPAQGAALVALASAAAGARAAARAPEPAATPRGDWHAMSPQDAFARLRATRRGQPPAGPAVPASASSGHDRAARAPSRLPLGPAALALRRAALSPQIQAAVLSPARGTAELVGAVRQELQDPLTPVLALGAMASAVVGSGVDAVLVAGVMAGNALVSGVQRMRAEHSLGRLLRGEEISATVVRWSPDGPAAGGEAGEAEAEPFPGMAQAPRERCPAHALEVGDIIALREGDVVPSDARLLLADGLEVDESPITGESLPVAKDSSPAPGVPLSERTCMVYDGCSVLAGQAFAVVTATRGATEAGRAALAAGRGAPQTGIQARLADLTRISIPASGLGGLAVGGLGLLRGVGLRQAVASGVAVAVAAVPEGLPLVATVAQLAAARRLTGTGVLVRSSRALEALGRVDVLCFDKTGTLTEGRLTVAKLAAPGPHVPFGAPETRHLLHVAARACPPIDSGGARALPHATDRAVVESAQRRAGMDRSWRLAEELPFEASRGYSASLGQAADGALLAVKGAPEVVLPRCAQVAAGARGRQGARPVPMTPDRLREAEEVLDRLTAQGLRVLAVAEAALPGSAEDYRLSRNGRNGANGRNGGNGRAGQDAEIGRHTGSAPDAGSGDGRNGGIPGDNGNGGPDDLIRNLTLTGFVAISDTVRPTARAAVRGLARAGVRVTMITGDHPATAVAVARKVGLPHADRVVTGLELASLPEAARADRIAAATVFARVSPEQKVRVVSSLRRAGHVVAMAGDGVNDAAAIRLADVGVGVTARGSTSARSAADLILTDSDPHRIIDALVEGRALWARVRDAVSILVGGNAGEVAFSLLGTAVTGRTPLSTRQLLLVNMLTDMLPALAVALSSGRPGPNGESPLIGAGPVGAFLAPELARSLAIRGGTTALGAFVAWQAGRLTGRRRRADTMGLATLVLTQLGQTVTTSGRSPLTLATSAASAGALAAIVETPGVSQFFGCTPLGPTAWAIVTGSAAGATAAGTLAPRFLPGGPRAG